MDESSLFGRILVRLGVIDDDQLDKILDEQKRRKNGKTPMLGDVGVAMGILTSADVEKALTHQSAWRCAVIEEMTKREGDGERAVAWLQAQAVCMSDMAEDLHRAVKKTKTGTMMVVKLSPET